MSELLRRLGPERTVPPCGGTAWRKAARSAVLSVKAMADHARPKPPNDCSQILLLHHVRREEEADFRRMLRKLSEGYRLVDYSEVALPGRRTQSGAKLAFSFDDGLKCNLRAAAILEEFGVRAAFFVCPPVHDERDPAVLARFCRERLRHEPAEFMTWRDIESLFDRGHVIGGHTQSHVDLGVVSDSVAAEEIASSRRELKWRFGRCDHFAWPYGTFNNITPTAVAAAFAAGFRSVASGVRGGHAAGGAVGEDAGPFPETLRRQSVEPLWPVHHVQHFLTAAARTPLAPPMSPLSASRAA